MPGFGICPTQREGWGLEILDLRCKDLFGPQEKRLVPKIPNPKSKIPNPKSLVKQQQLTLTTFLAACCGRNHLQTEQCRLLQGTPHSGLLLRLRE